MSDSASGAIQLVAQCQRNPVEIQGMAATTTTSLRMRYSARNLGKTYCARTDPGWNQAFAHYGFAGFLRMH